MRIHIHPLLWLVFGIGIVTASFKQLLMLFLIVLVHELGHAFAAQFFSWRIRKIMLLPFGGVAEVDEQGNRPFHEDVIVIVSGPLQHIWMMGLSYVLMTASIISPATHELFIYHNLLILGFNLLPIWPLDGGKLLFLLLSYRIPFLEAYKKSLLFSACLLAIISLFAAFLYLQQLHLWMIIFFLLYSLYTDWKHRQYVYMRFLLERYQGREREIKRLKTLTVSHEEKIHHILQQFQRGYKHVIIIQDDKREQMQIDENEVLHAYFTEKRIDSPIDELVSFY